MPPSDRIRVKRKADRGVYGRDVINAILDEALFCHVGYLHPDGYPIVIPTIHARIGDTLYLHGSPASRMLRTLRAGAEVCITVTLLDGLVMARSVFHHSMNYRSVMVFGTARGVADPDEKMAAFEAITEHVARGRWADARHPNETEFNGTTVVAIPLDEASAKVRTGGVGDEEEDYALDVWAGVIPVRTVFDDPQNDGRLKDGVDTPGYAADYTR